jgi:hypothetical protein
MSVFSSTHWWWPFVFILIAGWLPTDIWRFLGVALGGRMAEGSDLLILVRAVATALVAAVVGNLIVFPGGALAATPTALRFGAAIAGFAAYLLSGKRMIVGILTAEVILCVGLLTLP